METFFRLIASQASSSLGNYCSQSIPTHLGGENSPREYELKMFTVRYTSEEDL
jgi:hypothetical protein